MKKEFIISGVELGSSPSKVAGACSTCKTALTAPRIVPIHVVSYGNDGDINRTSQPPFKCIADRLQLRVPSNLFFAEVTVLLTRTPPLGISAHVSPTI